MSAAQTRKSIKRYWVSYKYKDRLFRKIFRNKKDLLQLNNAINNTAYTGSALFCKVI